MAEYRVVAIDGPAGSGKSTTARAVARKLGMAHLDSGALYRALTLAAVRHDSVLDDQGLVSLGTRLRVALGLRGDDFYPTIEGADVSDRVRAPDVTARVSSVAALPGVREWVTSQLRHAAGLHPAGVVCDGRDIGTDVFPRAQVKVFLTASVEERARRRALEEHGSTEPARVDRLSREILDRDRADSTRAVSPLRKADDAVTVDTSRLRIDEQVEQIVSLVRDSNSFQ